MFSRPFLCVSTDLGVFRSTQTNYIRTFRSIFDTSFSPDFSKYKVVSLVIRASLQVTEKVAEHASHRLIIHPPRERERERQRERAEREGDRCPDVHVLPRT